MMRRLFAIAALLVLPLALMLFAQWPLRELVRAYSREANDLAQIIFALYMGVAVTAASRAGTHLAAGHGVDPGAAIHKPRRWRVWALLACTAPWAVFILWTSAPQVWRSVQSLERFGETFNPGYFIIKAAMWLMVLLILINALLALRRQAPIDG